MALAAGPTGGVTVPNAAVAGDADATAVELNPGQLGFAEGSSSALIFNHWKDDAARPGRGGAAMLAVPLFSKIALGLGLHWLRPTLPGEPASYYKAQAGFGFRLGRGFALGAAWEHLYRSRYAGLDTFALGLGLRVNSAAAFGLALRDPGQPWLVRGSVRLPRSWTTEVALRWPGRDVIELGLGARIEEGDGRDTTMMPRARVGAHVARGLMLFGEIERDPGSGLAGTQYHGVLGLQVDFDRMAARVAAVDGPGASLMLRSSSSRRPSLRPERSIAQMKLAPGESDRDFVGQLARLRYLANDDTVAGVLLKVEGADLGLGRIEELREAIAGIRRRKPVVAHVANPSTREYYLAAACNHIVMQPAGGLGFSGLAQTVTFYKGAMEKLGVNLDLVRIAEYKGAMEPFVMEKQSDPVRQNRNAVLDDDFGRLLDGVARGRADHGLTAAGLRKLVDRGLFSPLEARAFHLVDAVADDDGIEDEVVRVVGKKLPLRDAGFGSFAGTWRPRRVAVVLVNGAIVEGEPPDSPFPAGEDAAWAGSIIKALEGARQDPSVGAIVLRVNSPGGSAFASDMIAREVAKVRKEGKPVIASLGDVAASGGYYVAAGAEKIFASPSTLTGSIGIFAYKVDVTGLASTLGLSTETFVRGAHADRYSVYRPWSDEERRQTLEHIQDLYRQFLETVARGRQHRGISAARADDLGRGQVWTGAQARWLGLTDETGGLLDAIDEAARRGGVEVGHGGLPELVVLPRRKKLNVAALLGVGATTSPAAFLPAPLARSATRLLLPFILGPGTGIEARLPYDVDFH